VPDSLDRAIERSLGLAEPEEAPDLDQAIERALSGRAGPIAPAPEPVEAGFFESLTGVPEQSARIIMSGISPEFAAQNIASHVEDVVKAQSGDATAARRARAYETAISALGTVTSLAVPGGSAAAGVRGLATRASLGALGGAIPPAAEAGAAGEEILPAAGRGAALGAVLGPAAAAGAGLLKLRAASRLARAGRPVPADLLESAKSQAADVARAGLPETDPVKRVVQALREVPDLRTEQEKLFRIERGKRIRKFKQAGEFVPGEAGARAQMAQLAGELPKVEFGSVRKLVSQGDIDQLFEMAKTSPRIGEWEKVNATDALLGLFKAEGFKLPTRSDLEILEKVFGSELVETLLAKGPELSRLHRFGIQLVNAPRQITASFDLSAPLRQGLFIGAGHPKEFVSAFGSMFKYWGSQKALNELEENIVARPTHELMRRAGLALTKAGSVVGQQEERFAGTLLKKVPGILHSERAYTGFLNKMRADVFDSMVKDAVRAGIDLSDDKALKQIGGFINAASGRGNLPQGALKHAETLNALFFSPRLLASRLQLMNPALYIRSNPVVRKHAIRSLLSLGSLATTTLALAKMGGAEVETDMTSSDWAKIKSGNTRYDILGGFQQYLRLGARIAQAAVEGEGVSEKVVGAAKPTLPFLRNKLAPLPSLVADLWKGTDFAGNEVQVPAAIMQRFTPLLLQDAWDTVQEYGWLGVPAVLPSVFGVGVTTYE